MLLTIREALATDGHLTNKQTTFHMGHVYRECNCSSASSLQTDRLRLFEDNGIRLGIDEFQTSLTCEGLLCSTEDTSRDGALVAIAQETRYVGLYHHILLGHGSTLNATIMHVTRMSDTHETPGRQTLRQCELQGNHTLLVGCQLGIEEGCLIEVFAHLYVLGTLLFLSD